MSISLNELLSQIQPLDLLFYKGNSLVSKLIIDAEEIVTCNGDWSHCSIVINKDVMPNLKNDETIDEKEFYVWESTLSTDFTLFSKKHSIVDVESKHGVMGVQIRKLKDLITNDLDNNTIVAWCKLSQNPFLDSSKKEEIKTKICQLHEVYYHRLYELNPLRMIFALFPKECMKRLSKKYLIGKDWIFCSELIAIIYKELNIYNSKIDPKLVIPIDIVNPDLSTGQYLPTVLENPIFLKKN